jgi:hypothetical protein
MSGRSLKEVQKPQERWQNAWTRSVGRVLGALLSIADGIRKARRYEVSLAGAVHCPGVGRARVRSRV